MVNIDKVRVLSVQIEDDDIEGFTSIMTKLVLTASQAGYNKTFTKQERITILNIAEALELDKPEECNIDVNKNSL